MTKNIQKQKKVAAATKGPADRGTSEADNGRLDLGADQGNGLAGSHCERFPVRYDQEDGTATCQQHRRRQGPALPYRRGAVMLEISAMANLDSDLEQLMAQGLPALRLLWAETYRSEAPIRLGQEFLRWAMAYRRQERAFGGLSRNVQLRLLRSSRAPGSSESGEAGPTTCKQSRMANAKQPARKLQFRMADNG